MSFLDSGFQVPSEETSLRMNNMSTTPNLKKQYPFMHQLLRIRYFKGPIKTTDNINAK